MFTSAGWKRQHDDECFGFLGFEFRYLRGLSGAMRPHYTPKLKKRTGFRKKVSARK
jgi:hypothetical protein